MKTSSRAFGLSVAIGAAANLVITSGLAEQATIPDGKRSVWSGVYTTAQSERGQNVHRESCVSCHGSRLNGAGEPDMPPSPAIAREGFLRKWVGRNVAQLSEYVRTKMPPDTPGTLNDQETVDAIAHMFATSNIPAGDKELPSDPKALAEIVIELQRK
jgi:mono/diheme cytochrome c family protein